MRDYTCPFCLSVLIRFDFVKKMASKVGLEPTTYALEERCCYPTELLGHLLSLRIELTTALL